MNITNLSKERVEELIEFMEVRFLTYFGADRNRDALLSILRDYQQTKAGVGPRIFPRVGQNPTLGGPSPGSLSTEDERAMQELESADDTICHMCKVINPQHKDCHECIDREGLLWAISHLRARLSAKPMLAKGDSAPAKVTREWWHRFLTEVQSGQFAEQMLREIGVIVEEEK